MNESTSQLVEPTLISKMHTTPQRLLQNFQRPQFLLLILSNGLRRDQFLRHPAPHQHKVFLADFHSTLLGVELAHLHPVPSLFKLELLRLVASKVHNIQPAHGGGFLAIHLQHAWWTVEETFESLNEDGSQGTGTQVAGHRFVTVKHTLIVADKREESGESIVLGGDEGQDLGELTGEVIDVEMMRMRLCELGGRCGLSGRIVGGAPLPFYSIGGIVCWMGYGRAHVVHDGRCRIMPKKSGLWRSDGRCPGCERRFVDLEEGRKSGTNCLTS